MNKDRGTIYLSKTDWAFLNTKKDEVSEFRSKGDVVSFLINYFIENETIVGDATEDVLTVLIEKTLEKFYKQTLEKELRLIKLKAGHADKSSQIMSEMINSLAINLGMEDKPSMTTDILMSKIYISAKEKLEREISLNQTKKKTKANNIE